MQYFLGTENVPMDIYAQVRPYEGKNDLVGYADFHLDNAVWIRDCRIYQKEGKEGLYIVPPGIKVTRPDKEPSSKPLYYAYFDPALQPAMQETVQKALEQKDHRAKTEMDCGSLFYQPSVVAMQEEWAEGKARLTVSAQEGNLHLFSVNSILICKKEGRVYLSMPGHYVENQEEKKFRQSISLDSPNHFQQNLILHEAQVKGLLPERADKDKSKEDMER